jgi:hypothetical protein
MKKPSKEMKLEERIECVLCAQELELDGNAYRGKYELNNGKSIKNFILDNLRNIYINLDTNAKIKVSRETAKKLIYHFKDDEDYQKTIAHIPKIIKKMQFLEEMKPDKEDANFDNYSYYITKARLDSESYTIFSVVGCVWNELYYDQNVFKGTAREVFAKAINEANNTKYSRLNAILQKAKKDGWDQIGVTPTEPPTTSNSKYNK